MLVKCFGGGPVSNFVRFRIFKVVWTFGRFDHVPSFEVRRGGFDGGANNTFKASLGFLSH